VITTEDQPQGRKLKMRKSLIALAALASVAGFAATQASAGSYGYGADAYGYNGYTPVSHKCFWKVKRVKVVKWVYGERVVSWKNVRVKVCPKHYGY
jgi:hypothetical protein